MAIVIQNVTHSNLSDSAKLAELEAENFYGNIEREEEIRYRLESLYKICGHILRRMWSVEAVQNLAIKDGAFTDEEIKLIENAHLIHMSEDGDHFEQMAVIRWIQKVASARKLGYHNDNYDHVVENLFNMIRFN